MKRETLLTIAVIALLLLNLGTLGVLFLKQQHSFPNHREPGRLIIEGLKLDEVQIDKFEISKDLHRSNMTQKDAEQRALQRELWSLLRTDNPDTVKATAIMTRIEALSHEKRMITFQHFAQIRALCRPEQKVLFDKLIEEIGEKLMPVAGPKPPPK
jgi:Spy/CpxP family protein refolding chaperone